MSSVTGSLTSHVLHLCRSDKADSHILFRASRSNSTSLEVNITATEGDSPYTATLRHSQLKKLRAKNYQGSDDEWKDTLLYVFGLHEEHPKRPKLLTGVEASASINGTGEDDKELVITVRKRIQSITQKLGSITLYQDEEQHIELFEWTNLAIDRADTLEQRFNNLSDRFHAAESKIDLLNKQLQEFICSKDQHEQELFSGFVQLLNEKKLKIRNQQRMLASANVDTGKLTMMQAVASSEQPRPKRKGGKGGRCKRAAEMIPADSSDDGFEKMGAEKSKHHANHGMDEGTDDEGQSTPEPIEDDGGTSSDDENAYSNRRSQRGDGQERRLPAQAASNSPPPRRELPFAGKLGKEPNSRHSSPVQKDPDEIGGETDDDEL
ncbi:uncharacterized protein DSM5745_00539 [Aspergillus mulundensis]|uniref:XRCC4 coiled-coil domain-containing protein n=1 Tax=Aspergillus mulundensis TaxID=1810919 RepID=A0A3D8T3T2_9EURO|nr:Uncharacterized protein DSM5745_00539 [Aspergillus mulundensis]RDW93217.1 Uncharacterized protein DSM5745_00539 [Aspergillus mulundensis]